jgi:hypothetical protein
MEPGRLRVKARVTTLGIDAGQQVEVEDTPAVRRKIEAGWLVELREMTDGGGSSIPK